MTTTEPTDTVLPASSQRVHVTAKANDVRVIAWRHPEPTDESTCLADIDQRLHDDRYMYVELEVGDLLFVVKGRPPQIAEFADRITAAAAKATRS